MHSWWRQVALLLGALFALPAPGIAQQTQPTPPPGGVHEHVDVTAPLLTPTRETTGTGWLPQTTPMYGVHREWRGWDWRVDGAVFVEALYEPRDRHRTGGFATGQGSSANWFMVGARRRIGDGRVGLRTMISAEPWTVPGCGSLSFLATGEVCDDDTIHDRQQPHDLIMELAADYDRPLAGDWRWQVYAGLAGEPALGPPASPHRASSLMNPIGPITHHWLDSAKVTFGVVTLGVAGRRWKLESSVFNGRSPDENRADLDLGAFDSFSARVSYLPSDRLVVQVSAGRLDESRTDSALGPADPIVRVTGSVVYHVPVGDNGIWATTVAMGTNHVREPTVLGVLEATTFAALVETRVTRSERHTFFGRAEGGGMPAHHLHAHEYATEVFPIGKFQIGYVRHLPAMKGLLPGIGGTVALSLLSPKLAPRYFGSVAPTYSVFFSLQAARHQM
jgi:hypothetical protein